ncbi:MAG TPA: enoyl-CoA hydratase-related protein [Alphaproteobacteria bacterium]|nr:enoyl-CoA hydratase-related protein [Alphaproteobacteria bacterium]
MDSPILLDVAPPFARLILNRPEKRNAISQAMWSALPGLIDRIEADPNIRVVMVSGAGGSFAAGADIGEFESLMRHPERAGALADGLGQAMRRLAGLTRPTIAVIQGACVGGGCGIALCCDFRFADTGAEFGITPSRLGITYLLEDTKRLIDTVGVAHARDLLMTGHLIDAERALAIGLVDRVLSPESLWPEAQRYATVIAERSQYSVRAVKATIGEILAGALAESERTRRLFVDSFTGEDLEEGARAFLEKRPPRFTYS